MVYKTDQILNYGYVNDDCMARVWILKREIVQMVNNPVQKVPAGSKQCSIKPEATNILRLVSTQVPPAPAVQ